MTNRLTQILIMTCFVALSSCASGQKNDGPQSIINDDRYGFSFEVDTAFWKKANDQKIARKVRYDMTTRGARTSYEYIFTRDNDSIMSRPAVLVVVVPTAKNEFFAGKERANQPAKISRQKGNKYFPDINRILIS